MVNVLAQYKNTINEFTKAIWVSLLHKPKIYENSMNEFTKATWVSLFHELKINQTFWSKNNRTSLPCSFLVVNNGSSINVGSDQAMRCVMCHYVLQVHNVVAPQEIKRSLSLWIMTIKQLQWINTLLLCTKSLGPIRWPPMFKILQQKGVRKGQNNMLMLGMMQSLSISEMLILTTMKMWGKKIPWRSSILHCQRLFFDLYYWAPLDVVAFDFQVVPSNFVSK